MNAAPNNRRRRGWYWSVLVVASLLLLGSIAWVVAGGVSAGRSNGSLPGGSGYAAPGYGGSGYGGPGPGGSGGMWGRGAGGGMMAGQVWSPGNGVAVTTIPAARARASEAAASRGLQTGEVIQFSQNFYVELKDSAGESATEVLVDPRTGAVSTEPGPAMMWNTGSRTAQIPADRATAIANDWLKANRPAETAGKAEAYPGYYTIDTVSGGKTAGMLSVDATTGQVWYHTWHGTYIASEDA